jgi:ribosomal protein S27AE
MKLCTAVKVEQGKAAAIEEFSLVGDDHQFGLAADGAHLHIEGSLTPVAQESITCPRCGRTSWNANDVREGFCGACHDWTGRVGYHDTAGK